MGTCSGSVPISGKCRVPSPAPPDLNESPGKASSCRFSIPETFGSFARRAIYIHTNMHDVSDRRGLWPTEHRTQQGRSGHLAARQGLRIRTGGRSSNGTARCAGPDPRCSGLSTIPPVTRCVVVDLAPQAMIGRAWVCARSIRTDKTHRQGAITRCIHATECQAAVPWFTFTTFTVAHVQFGMHAARAHPHKHMRMCSSAYELHFDVSTTPRRACAAEKRRFARQLVHDDFCICAPERN